VLLGNWFKMFRDKAGVSQCHKQTTDDLVSYPKSKDTSSTLLQNLETGIVSMGILYKPSPLTESYVVLKFVNS
jgi:hypothetical protein